MTATEAYGLLSAVEICTGKYHNCLTRTHDADSVFDLKTGLRWQLGGSDISSVRQLQRWANQKLDEFAGHTDWRLPTIEET